MSEYRKLEGGELERARTLFPDIECYEIHLNEELQPPHLLIFRGENTSGYSCPITDLDARYIKTNVRLSNRGRK